MPIPTPRDRETEDDFIGRCMGAIGGEYEQDQALAICYGQWRDRGKTMGQRPTSRAALLEAAKSGADTQALLVRKALVPDSVEPVEGQTRTVRFILSTAAVDRDGDTIDPKGWDLKSYLKNPVVLWAHDYHSLPVGRATSVAISDGKLVSECEFASHEFAETVYQLVSGGFLRATSVGFKPRKYTINEERHGLDFTEQELMEYSIVPVPANPEAVIDMAGAKAAGIDVDSLVVWAKSVLADQVDPPQVESTGSTIISSFEIVPPVDATPPAAPETEAEKTPKPCGCTGGPDEHQDGCRDKPKGGPPDTCDPVNGTCQDGYALGEDGRCHLVQKPPKAADPTCRICEQVLTTKIPRLRDDLGLVCASCFLRAATPAEPITEVPPVAVPAKEAEAEASVLDLDDDPRVEVAVELDDDDEAVVDLSPEEVRAALRSAVTRAVSTIVREETRAALNRARGRVD
jgi:HK97 family phage prohead protease